MTAMQNKKRGIRGDEWTKIYEVTVGGCRVRRHILAPITADHRTDMGFRYPSEDIGCALVLDVNLTFNSGVSGMAWSSHSVITTMEDPVVVKALAQPSAKTNWKVFDGAHAGRSLMGSVLLPDHMSQLDVLHHLVKDMHYPASICVEL